MPQQFPQNIEVLSSASVVTVRLDADNFSKPPQSLPGGGSVAVADPNGKYTISLHGRDASFSAGGSGHKGVATLRNGAGGVTVAIGGADAGELHLRNQNSNVTVTLRAEDNTLAGLWMGGGGQAGVTTLRNAAGKDTVSLGGGDTGDLYLRNKAGNFTVALRAVENNVAGLWMGSNGQTGLAILRNGAGHNTVSVGGGDTGDIYLYNKAGKFTVALRAVENDVAGLWMGGNGQRGNLYLRNNDGDATIALRAVDENNVAGIWVGGGGSQSGLIVLRKSDGRDTVVLDGEAGDISLLAADCAEEFDILETEQIDPGCVVVFGPDGKLRQSTQPYDRKVAGVISGAGAYKPGIVFDQQGANEHRRPLAMMGKVYCKVDAGPSPIEVGDLLTTSSTLGHAMKAADQARAFGTIVGKALAPLDEGQALIPVLVVRQ